MIWFSCLLLFGTLLSVICQEPFQDLLKSTRKLVDYYKQQYRNMNLDGIYGLRVLEGQTSLILQHSPNVDLETRTFLTSINQDARNISEMSLSFLKRNEGEYFAKLYPLVSQPLLIAKPYRRLDPKLRWPAKGTGKRQEISEVKSDQCITNVLGSGAGSICYMPRDCLNIFTEPGYCDYSLTHQILYTLVVEQNGCVDGYNKYLEEKGYEGGMAHIQLEFCTNVFYEAASLVHQQTLTPITQDLFMEQVFACGVMGFMEFVHVDWLRRIIQWQKPSGCYGVMPRVTNKRMLPRDMDYEYLNEKVEREDARKGNFNDAYEGKPKHSDNLELLDDNTPEKNNRARRPNNFPHFVADDSDTKINDGLVGWREPVVGKQVRSEAGLLEQIKNKQIWQQDIKTHMPGAKGLYRPVGGDTLLAKRQVLDQGPQQKNSITNEMFPKEGLQQNSVKIPSQDVVMQGRLGNHKLIYMLTELFNDTKFNTGYKQETSHLPAQRRLLVEKSLEGGCLSHKTAVAAGMLSQYLRFYLVPSPSEYEAAVQIDGVNHMLSISGESSIGHPISLDTNKDGPKLSPDSKRDVAPDSQLANQYVMQKMVEGQNNMDIIEKPYYADADTNTHDRRRHFGTGVLPIKKELKREDQMFMGLENHNDMVVAGPVKHYPINDIHNFNPKHKPVLALEHDVGNYPFYYNKEKRVTNNKHFPAVDFQGIHVAIESSHYMPPKPSNIASGDSGVSVGTIYAVLLVIMLVMLFYISKFIRLRKIMIKYH